MRKEAKTHARGEAASHYAILSSWNVDRLPRLSCMAMLLHHAATRGSIPDSGIVFQESGNKLDDKTDHL